MREEINYSELGNCIIPAFVDEINHLALKENAFTKKSHNTSRSADELLEEVVLLETINFLKKRKIHLLLIAGPNKHIINGIDDAPYLFRKISLEEVLEDRDYLEKFCDYDKNLLNYIYDRESGVLTGNRITTNGVHLLSAYFKSEYVNVDIFGERKSSPSVKGNYSNNIYLFGSCLTFGLFSDDDRTFPSMLQKQLNSSNFAGMKVHNYGVKGQNCVLNDLLFILNTPMREGDFVILVAKYSHKILTLLRNNHIACNDFSNFLKSKSVNGQCFLNSAFHCNSSIYRYLADYTFSLIKERMKNSSAERIHPEIYSYLENTKKKSMINSEGLIDKLFIKDLISSIKSNRFETGKEAVIGSIVMAANPFTWGHAKLVELVTKEGDFCYVFVIEDNHFEIPFPKRYDMVDKFAQQYKNCRVFATGCYFGADFLFPEYHDRNKYEKQEINNPVIDTMIFAKHIAPVLGINRRYLGTETNDPVTNQFNNYLSSTLPQYGIEVKIVPRFITSETNEEIRGGLVRKLISENPNSDVLKYFLPPTSIQVLT